jgi:selenocysteine lyase/cysteine desulfurase
MRQMVLVGAVGGLPWRQAIDEIVPLPPKELLSTHPEDYWARVRQDQFLLADARPFLNPGSLGVAPRPVLQAMFDAMKQAAAYADEEVPRWGYERLENERVAMADFLGCHADELAFTHNCTEALSTIANGLDLQSGDEVLTTDQEHGSGYACWQLKAARYGTTLRQVALPPAPREPGELTERLISAIGPKTRVLFFSAITSPTGLILPVKDICQAARDRGLISVVDGAHLNGQMPVQLRELGCDYYAGSPHKWLFAPPGCGFLYGRENRLDQLWPNVVSHGWDNKSEWRSARFMLVGTNNLATIDGMLAGVRFLQELGESAVYQRMHQMAEMALREVQRRDYLELVNADDARFYRAIIAIRFKSDGLDPLWAAFKTHNIHVLETQPLRLSVHIHTRPADLQAFFETCDQVFRR